MEYRRRRVIAPGGGPVLTEQHHANEFDMKAIVAKAKRTGYLPLREGAMYGDFSSIGTYHEALTAVRDAQAAFMKLPGEIRKRFANDPGKLLDFLSDEGNREEAVRLGIVQRSPVVEAAEAVAEAAEGGVAESTPET